MIERLELLPPIPKIAQKILALKISTDEGERELFKLIEKDPALMSKIIGLSNSPLFGTGRKILNLHDAEAVLGSKRVKMIALSFAMMSSVSKKETGLLNIEGLWKHSLAIALTMDTLARYMPKDRRPPDDEIYLAGLLHDIGFMVLNYLDTKLCDQFCAQMDADPNRPVEEVEAEILKMNHSELGAELARHWGLPANIYAVLLYHHSPSECQDEAQQPLVLLAHVAEKLLPTFGIVESVSMGIAADQWQLLGIDPILIEEIKAKTQMHANQIAALSV